MRGGGVGTASSAHRVPPNGFEGLYASMRSQRLRHDASKIAAKITIVNIWVTLLPWLYALLGK